MHNKLVQNFEFVINTLKQPNHFKVTNTKHNISNIEKHKIDGDENLETESDEETSEESEYSISDQSEAEYSNNNESTSASSPSKVSFIVYWSSLPVLLNKCLTCCLSGSVTNITLKGSQLIVQLICSDKHKTTWISQPSAQRYLKENLNLAATVLSNANAFQKNSKYFEITNIQWITKTSYYSIQDKFLARIVNKNYSKMNASITHRLIEQVPRKLSDDDRCDSPGCNTKYLICSLMTLMNQEANEIVAFSIAQVTEA